MKLTKEFYNIKEFSELLGINPRTVSVNVTRAPQLVPRITRVGRAIRFASTDIIEFISDCQKCQ